MAALVVAVGVLVGTAPEAQTARPTAARLTAARVQAPVYSGDFPDPDVVAVGDRYYAFSTQVRLENVPELVSSNLVSWTPVGDALPVLPVWAKWGRTWAPSVVEHDGSFVMFFTADDAATGRECIGRATSRSVSGPFVDTSSRPFLCQGWLGGSIDPFVFANGHHSYLLWKNNGNANGTEVRLWSTRLGEGDSTRHGRHRLLAATAAFEAGIIEGPTMAEDRGVFYLLFSANRWDSSKYEIGWTTCSSPTGPCDASTARVLLASKPGSLGPGGPAAFASRRGQIMVAYSAWTGRVGYPAGSRELFLRTLRRRHGRISTRAFPIRSVGAAA